MAVVVVDGELNMLSSNEDWKGVLSKDPGRIVGNPSLNVDLIEGIPEREAREPSSIPIPLLMNLQDLLWKYRLKDE